MTRPSRRAVVVFLAAALLAFLASYRKALPSGGAPVEVEPREEVIPLPLVPGTEISATLAGGQAHHYGLRLERDQFVDLVVEQQGIDVILKLFKPDGEQETLVDSPNEAKGPEPLPVLGETAGEYRLSVIAGSDRDPPGRYTLRLLAVREADAPDRARVAAERSFAVGEGLRRTGTAESLEKAVGHDLGALAGLRSLGDRQREADVLFALGNVHRLRDDWRQALVVYEQALPRFREAGRDLCEATTLNNLGLVWNEIKQFGRALDLFRQAEALYRRLGHRDQALAVSNIGLAYEGLGDLESAFRAHRTARGEFRRRGDLLGASVCLLNIGRLYLRRGQTDRAIDACEEARGVLENSAREREYALTLTMLGEAQYFSGRAEQGRSPLETALTIQQHLGARRDEAISHNSLALILHETGETERAKAHLREAAAIGSSLGDEAERAVTLTNLGHLELESGSEEVAQRLFQEALATFAEVDSPAGESTALFGLGKLLALQGKLEEAAVAFERCTRRAEDLRNTTASSNLRMLLLERYQPTYGSHIETLMRLHASNPDAGFDVKAFEAAERSRARSLLDDLLASPAALRRSGLRELVDEEVALSQTINRTAEERQTLLAVTTSEQRLENLSRGLRAQLAAADHLEATMRRDNSSFREIPSVPTLTLQQIQREVLDEDTALLEYALGNSESYLWAVTSHTASSFRLPPRRELEELAVALYRALSLGNQPLASGQAESLLDRLSGALLRPAAALIRGRRIVVVPDGDLALIPFAALRIPSAGGSDPPDREVYPQPLTTRHELTVLPSASSLSLLRRRSQTRSLAPGLLAAMGDAVFNDGDPRFGETGPARAQNSGSSYSHFPRLLYARNELDAILALAGEEPKLAAFGFAANRQTLVNAVLSRYRIIHFATHGVFDPEFPELSGIVLSTLDENAAPQDGFVRAHELRRMDLQAELVVVSACETARGRKVRGEGLVGLASSLLSAGAQRVLVSLWEVDDQATAMLMNEFYRGLLVEQQTPAAALQRAQAAVARQTRWRSPYFWAGFILIGDGSELLQGIVAKPDRPEPHLRSG